MHLGENMVDPMTMLVLVYAVSIPLAFAPRIGKTVTCLAIAVAGIIALTLSRESISHVYAYGLPLLELHGELGVAALLLNVFLALIVAGLAPARGAVLALTLVASASSLLILMADSVPVLLLGLEAASIAVIGLLALEDKRVALRYAVVSLFSASIIVLGAAILWANGFKTIHGLGGPEAALGLALLVAGVAAETGLAPFHMWVPDVASRGSGLGLSVAALAVDTPLLVTLYRIVSGIEPGLPYVATMLLVLSIASMCVGELSALAQRDVRRMVGFSVVSDAGYIVLLALGESLSGRIGLWPAIVFATASGASLALAFASTRPGLGPVYGLPLATSLLCLAGLPPLYGFPAKLSVVTAFAEAGLPYLAVIAAVFFVVSAVYNVRYVVVNAADLASKPSPAPFILYSFTLVALGLAPHVLMVLGGV